ncbi:hypothetical protein IWQ62_006309, partial [Dispira parvispora]
KSRDLNANIRPAGLVSATTPRKAAHQGFRRPRCKTLSQGLVPGSIVSHIQHLEGPE